MQDERTVKQMQNSAGVVLRWMAGSSRESFRGCVGPADGSFPSSDLHARSLTKHIRLVWCRCTSGTTATDGPTVSKASWLDQGPTLVHPLDPKKDPSLRSFVSISEEEANGPRTVHGPRVVVDRPNRRAPSLKRRFATAFRHETCEEDGADDDACMARERASVQFHGCGVRRAVARTVQRQLQPCFLHLCTHPFRPFPTLPRAPRNLVLGRTPILSRARGIHAWQRRQSLARLRFATTRRPPTSTTRSDFSFHPTSVSASLSDGLGSVWNPPHNGPRPWSASATSSTRAPLRRF